MNSNLRHFLYNAQGTVRSLPFITLLWAACTSQNTGLGQVFWSPQGPAPVRTNGAYTNESGAIEAILVDPSVSGRAFIGAVNGGIWRTTDLYSGSPTWTSLTDQMDSLSIADIRFSPLDVSYSTIFAGIGGFSSQGSSGPLIGLLKSTDAGDTWVNIARSTLGGHKVRNVIPTGVLISGQQVVLAATRDAGLFRSTDGGNSFTLVSGANGLPPGDVSHLVADPASPATIYAALPFKGVFVTSNAGQTWSDMTANLPTTVLNIAERIELTVSPAAPNPVYAALIGTVPPGGPAAQDIFRWDGSSWTAMGLMSPSRNPNAGGEGNIAFAMLAHRTDPNVVFVSGDIGGVWRGSIGNWVQVDGANANDTGPHADSRDMVYDFNGRDILESSDGGLERLVNPDGTGSPSRHWESINGNLQITEFNFISFAYDTLNHVIFGGTQDNGSPQQVSGSNGNCEDVPGGDGTMQAVDNSAQNKTIRYYTSHGSLGTYGAEKLLRRDYDSANHTIAINGETTHHPNLADPSTPTTVDSGLKHGGKGGFVVNRVTPSRLLLFGSGLYEGTVDGSGNGNYGETINDITLNGQQDASGPTIYGAVGNPDLIYLPLQVSNSWGLYLRTSAGGPIQRLPFPNGTFPSRRVFGIAMDEANWRRVYALDDHDRVYQTADAGATWTDITGN